jgi:ligand-binding SRPBCC domain-containing protein
LRTFAFQRQSFVPRPREEVFAFFASPSNLGLLTPPWLHFRIASPLPHAVGVGTRLDYRLRVFYGLPLHWQSEIAAWEPPHRFVDAQRRGPFHHWRHEHRFSALPGGTAVVDEVRYAVPGGRLVQRLLVAGAVERIFAYRERRQLELLAPEIAGRRP